MHLVGYLYKDYHDAQSLEHKVTIHHRQAVTVYETRVYTVFKLH
jgi:hypothetical protein